MSDLNAKLEIYVLGGKLGESIIIRTPSGAFGVIDSYASSLTDPTTNPTLKRLEELGAKRLRFIALSHPHVDHFKGLFTLFQRYKGNIEQFWRFPFGQANWSVLFQQFIEEYNLEETIKGRLTIAQKIKDLKRILELANAEKKTGMMPVTTQDEKIMLDEEGLSIICLGPSTEIVDVYQEALAKQVIVRQSHTAEADHNLISSVLAVKYGDWVGILGGDTEQRCWHDILERCGNKWIEGASFVKVSHHGSPTGSFDGLWQNFKSSSCEVVVTCYEKQGLPKATGVQCIFERGFSLHSTNATVAIQLCNETKTPPTYSTKPSVTHEPLESQHGGEVRITVDEAGQATVDYFGAAGPLYVAQAKSNEPV